MQLLILSEYFLKIVVRVGLHNMIPSGGSGFLHHHFCKIKEISSRYLNSHHIRNHTLIPDCHKHKLSDSNCFQDNYCYYFLSENLRLTSGHSH